MPSDRKTNGPTLAAQSQPSQADWTGFAPTSNAPASSQPVSGLAEWVGFSAPAAHGVPG